MKKKKREKKKKKKKKRGRGLTRNFAHIVLFCFVVFTSKNKSREYTHQCDETKGNNSTQALSTYSTQALSTIVHKRFRVQEDRQTIKKKETMKRTDKKEREAKKRIFMSVSAAVDQEVGLDFS